MANSETTLYANDAVAPNATRVSIFGDLCISPLKPLTKNF